MRLEAELHRDVAWFLQHRCSSREVAAFYDRLEAVRTDPIGNSEGPLTDPSISRYALRFFRFGTNLAVFGFDRTRKRIRVVQCRKVPPKKPAGKRRFDVDPP